MTALPEDTTEQPDPVPLSTDEQQQLQVCEETLMRRRVSYVEVGHALSLIQLERLYRQTHSTFETYCKSAWQISRNRAYRLIEAFKVVEPMLPNGNIPTHKDLVLMLSNGNIPPSEAVARPLVKFAPGQQREAWEAALEASANGKPTARDVEEACQRLFRSDEGVLHFEVRPQTAAASKRVAYLEQFFSYVDQQPAAGRRQLLETERDQVIAAFQQRINTLGASGIATQKRPLTR
jgi:hypothetical protein